MRCCLTADDADPQALPSMSRVGRLKATFWPLALARIALAGCVPETACFWPSEPTLLRVHALTTSAPCVPCAQLRGAAGGQEPEREPCHEVLPGHGRTHALPGLAALARPNHHLPHRHKHGGERAAGRLCNSLAPLARGACTRLHQHARSRISSFSAPSSILPPITHHPSPPVTFHDRWSAAHSRGPRRPSGWVRGRR